LICCEADARHKKNYPAHLQNKREIPKAKIEK